MNQEKIREVALRVAREMHMEGWNISDTASVVHLTRCIAELSKGVEPVGWWNGKETAYFEHETGGPVGEVNIPIYLRPPLTEQDKLDAAQWRAYQKRKQDLLDRGFLRNPLRDETNDRAMENGK